MKKSSLRHKSILFDWACSYMLILWIPFLAIFINYSYNTKVIREEIMEANDLILKNLRSEIDQNLAECVAAY